MINFHIGNSISVKPLTLLLGDEEVSFCDTCKFLRWFQVITLDFTITQIKFSGIKNPIWDHHNSGRTAKGYILICYEAYIKLSLGIFIKRSLSKFSDSLVSLATYYGLIYPYLSYLVAVWGCKSIRMGFVFRLQKRTLRGVFRKYCHTPCKLVFKENKNLTLSYIFILSCLVYVSFSTVIPSYQKTK